MSIINISMQDITDTAYTWGFEDATAGNDQWGSAYFELGSSAWIAYNEGYADGCHVLYLLTGRQRYVWIPQENLR